jgi:hypothetical protein
MTDSLLNVLDSYETIGLSEIDNIRLMDRLDTKYVVSAQRIPDIIRLLNGKYKALEINGMKAHLYVTDYYDTSDFLFYNQHITSRKERYKIRFRTYKTSETTYLEIKKHTRFNRTIKWRIENNLNHSGNFDDTASDFLYSYIPEIGNKLVHSLSNSFKRLTLAGIETNERITIDFDLHYSTGGDNKVSIPWIAIIEHKRDRSGENTEFHRIIKDKSIRPTGFSKYCLGVSLLNNGVRKNMLKEKVLLVNKIKNEFNRS